MFSQWSYLIMVLWLTVTSSALIDHHGNRANLHGNQLSDVSEEILTPPIDFKSQEIDSFSIKLDANEAICRELCKNGDGGNACLCDWPPLRKELLLSLKKEHRKNEVSFFKFPKAEDEPACRLLCRNGEDGHFCLCN